MRVLIMGLGVHGGGLGTARWLLRQGASITITDMASAEALAEPLAALARAEQEHGATIRYVLGEHRAEDFTSHDMLVVNPAVRPDSPWIALARQTGLRIETQMTLFFRHCPGPILGITGTKGKTTTTLLTGAMLRQQYPDTVVAGNLRISALEALDRITPTTPVVLELSSFQLVALGAAHLSPAYACVTNLSPDHLNYHGSMEDYAHAKQQIFLHQPDTGVLILNEDLLPQQASGGRAAYDWADVVRAVRGRVRTFGARPGSTAHCRVTAHGQIELCGEHLLDRADISLPGTHNLENVLAAAALARSFGISPEHIRAAVRDFGGVEHRLELVRSLDGVRYINDTTATNPTAACTALESLDAPVVLLAGGSDKGLPFDTFAQRIVQRARVLILLSGSATEKLRQAVREYMQMKNQRQRAEHSLPRPPILGPYDDFAAAIRTARELAAPGDVVLLSPGCASFGMFRNEFHRGEEFRRIVQDELESRRPAEDSAEMG